MAIKFSAMEHFHKYKQTKCNITNNLWLGDALLMKAPTERYKTFSLWEMNVLENIYKDFWGLSLMNFLRSLQEFEVKSLFDIQRYLDSMEAIDIRRRKEFHKKTTPRMNFQDVARREMAREKRESLKKGINRERKYMKKYAENKRHYQKEKIYAERTKKMDVERRIKRYVPFIS